MNRARTSSTRRSAAALIATLAMLTAAGCSKSTPSAVSSGSAGPASTSASPTPSPDPTSSAKQLILERLKEVDRTSDRMSAHVRQHPSELRGLATPQLISKYNKLTHGARQYTIGPTVRTYGKVTVRDVTATVDECVDQRHQKIQIVGGPLQDLSRFKPERAVVTMVLESGTWLVANAALLPKHC